MDTKEIKINIPEGYEIDRENSTFECIKFKKKGLTYKDVCNALFSGNNTYYIETAGDIGHTVARGKDVYSPNNATSKQQLKSLLAINKLMNVAAYLNEKPLDWDNVFQDKWHIFYDHRSRALRYGENQSYREAIVYFDSREHANQAVEILGEDTVKQALGIFD